MSTYWIKLYVELIDDRKFMRVSLEAQARFMHLLCIAGKENAGGELPTTGDLAWLLRCEEAELEPQLTELEGAGILQRTENGWLLVNFAKRQAAVPGDERYKEFRKRNPQYPTPELKRNANAIKTNRLEITDTDTDNRIDTDTESDTDARASGETKAFSKLQSICETQTGCMMTPLDIPAVDEMVKAGATEADIMAAVAFFKDQGRTVTHINKLVPSVRFAISKRVQGGVKAPAQTDKRRALAESWGAILAPDEAEARA
jgi:hypothetical protein